MAGRSRSKRKSDNEQGEGQGGDFYLRQGKLLAADDLPAALADGLLDEIALLRVAIRRVFEHAASGEEQDLATWDRTLTTLSNAAARLAGLLRTQKLLHPQGDAVQDAVAQALKELTGELNLR
jgi:hypothetical protein